MITSLGFETLGKLAVYTWYGYEDISRRDGQIQKKKTQSEYKQIMWTECIDS